MSGEPRVTDATAADADGALMVGVPSALHLAAGLVAVSACGGLAVAIFMGGLEKPGTRTPSPGRRSAVGVSPLIGTFGAVAYGTGHLMWGASLTSPEITLWVQIAGLVAMSFGAGPTREGDAVAAGLLIPLAPAAPAYAAAVLAVMSAARIGGAGRRAGLAVLAMLAFGAGHGLQPTNVALADLAFLGGGLLLTAWLWMIAGTRVVARILAAVVVSLVGLSIVLSGVLSTVGTAELTNDELSRLARVGGTLVADVQDWPADALTSASAVGIAPRALLSGPLPPEDAADLYQVGFAGQDFFVVLDASGAVLTAHPPDLGGSIELSLVGDARIQALRESDGGVQKAGGLQTTGGRVVAFGAVTLRGEASLPEDPPQGVLITGRIVDSVWAERQAATADVALIAVVGGQPTVVTDGLDAPAGDVVERLGDRPVAELSGSDTPLLAASNDLVDPDSGEVLARLVTTSSPTALAVLEALQVQRLFLVSIAGTVLAVALATLVTTRLVRPITRLTEAARRIAEGDLDARADVRSRDELGVLGTTFDTMVGNLVSQQDELATSARTQSRLRGRLESLTASMEDGLIATDADGAVIQFNPAAERLTGLRALTATGAPLAEVLEGRFQRHRDDSAVTGLGTIDDLGLDGSQVSRPVVGRLRLVRPDGGTTSVAVTASPVRGDDDAVIGTVFVLRDIGREIEVERMKTEFLANVSHELRTPITPIKGYADVLSRRELDGETTQRFAGQILDSTMRLERIVNMIVDFAALDSGRVVLQPARIDLPELVDGVLETWRQRHPQREFGAYLHPRMPRVEADPVYLRKVLDELLDNAVKFSPDGQPVDLTSAVGADEVRLSVVDRGVGIDEAAAANLFTDFKQADGTETRHFGGLGLGLGLVKRILEGSRARIELESEVGIGSTFSLVLPTSGAAMPPALPDPPARSMRVPPPPA